MHEYVIDIGDRWNDGHGRFETVKFSVNKPKFELDELYKRIYSELKINFDEVANGRSNQAITTEMHEKFKAAGVEVVPGYPEDKFIDDGARGYMDLMFRTMQHLDSTLEYDFSSDDTPSWNPPGNYTLGYGLFMN